MEGELDVANARMEGVNLNETLGLMINNFDIIDVGPSSPSQEEKSQTPRTGTLPPQNTRGQYQPVHQNFHAHQKSKAGYQIRFRNHLQSGIIART